MRSPLALGLGVVGLCGCGLVVTLALDARSIAPTRMPMVVPDIPAEQNGWPLLREACKRYERFPTGTRLGKSSLAMGTDPRVIDHLARNADALRLADAALAKPHFRFGREHYIDDVTDLDRSAWASQAVGIAGLYEQRSLAGLATSDDARATADAASAMALGRRVQGLGGSLCTRECGLILEYAGHRAMRRIAGLHEHLSPARREGLRSLIALCLDESDMRPNVEEALTAEDWLARVWMLPSLEAGKRQSSVFRPVSERLCLDQRETARGIEDALIEVKVAAGKPNWSTRLNANLSATSGRSPLRHNSVGRLCRDWVSRIAWDSLRDSYHLGASRRLSAMSAALRLYQDRHDGLPERLDALVADGLLPSVPLDPLGDGSIRYSPRSGLVYSVGSNGRDDGGVYDTRPAGSQDTTPLVHDDHPVPLVWSGNRGN